MVLNVWYSGFKGGDPFANAVLSKVLPFTSSTLQGHSVLYTPEKHIISIRENNNRISVTTT